jgi:hypothetical protein
MNLYLISQSVNNDYDTYDSAVVAANSEEEARTTHPSSNNDCFNSSFSTWCSPDKVEVKLIGTSIDDKPGVICASFNAG